MSNLIRSAVNFFKGVGDQQSYSKLKESDSNRSKGVSVGFESETTDLTTDIFKQNVASSGINPFYEPLDSKIEEPLAANHSFSDSHAMSEEPQTAMKKSGNIFMRILQPLIKAFKEHQTAVKNQAAAKALSEISGNLKADIHGKKSAKLAESIKQNPQSAKLGGTLNKFTHKGFQLTTKDSNNLNEYFSEGHIGPGIDALVDLYQSDNKEAFKQALSSLTPENYTKVSEQLENLNDGEMINSMREVEQDKGGLGQNIHVLVRELKSNSEDSEAIDDFIGNIMSTALTFCPENASKDYKQVAVHQALANALGLLQDMPDEQNAVKAEMENNILEFAGIDNFDKLSELYSDPDRIEIANTAIAMLADADPDKAGKILHQATDRSTLPSEKIDKVAENVMQGIHSTTARAALVGGALKSEVEAHSQSSPGNLLRGNTIGSKLLGQFSQKHVIPHFTNSPRLQKALQELPKENMISINSETREKSISSKNIEITKDHIAEILTILQKIATDSESEELSAFYDMCRDVQDTVQDRFGEQSAQTVPLNFLFLRGLNAAVISSTIKFEGQQQRNAITVTKVIQNMVNQVNFDNKEQYMTGFNSFLETGREPIDNIGQYLSGH